MDRHRILVVDDERTIVSALHDVLEEEGYEVASFTDPLVAVGALREGPFDCVITDLLMPGMSGLEIVRTVRELQPAAAIVVITGAPDLETAVEALRLGASDYIVKPVFDKEIERVVARVIERAQLLETVRRRSAELELLLEASRAFSTCLSEPEVAETVERFSARIEEAERSDLARQTLRNMGTETHSRIELLRLREQAMLAALLDSHPTGIVYIDAEGPPFVNRRASELLGTGAADDAEALANLIGNVEVRIQEVASTSTGMAEIRSPADPGRMLELRCGRVMEQERYLGTIVTVTDVTEEREREDNLQIASRLATTSRMLSGLCHELNNPLTVVLGLSEEMTRSADPEAAGRAARVLAAGERCAELVRKFVELANPNRSRSGLLELADVVPAVLDLLRPALSEGQVTLETHVEEVPLVAGSPGEVKDALLALCLNAIDAMQAGGTLTVRVQTAPEGGALVQISDTGLGMTPEVKARIFDPLYTTKQTASATGLGLSLVHATCTRMGGMVAVDSAPGEGTTVRLTFPAAVVPERSSSAAAAP